MKEYCERCRAELRHLTEENESLRRTALALGRLAERLNRERAEEYRTSLAQEREPAVGRRAR